MKACILGASGFLGGNLLEYFHKSDIDVFGISRSKSELISNKANNLIRVHDLTDTSSCLDQLLSGVDLVIDCSESANPYNLDSRSLRISLLPILSQIETRLEHMERLKVGKYIYLSSGGAVYGPSHGPSKETKTLQPESYYGLIKQMEEALIIFLQRQKSIDVNIIRASNPYGPLHPLKKQQGVINIFIRKILQGQEIEVWGDPAKSVKDYIYIDALCSAIKKLSTVKSKNVIYNIGSSVPTSLLEALTIIEQECGLQARCNYVKSNPNDTHAFLLDTSRFQSEIGDIKQISLRDGIRKTIGWYNDILFSLPR